MKMKYVFIFQQKIIREVINNQVEMLMPSQEIHNR